jgi:hypothetical protein
MLVVSAADVVAEADALDARAMLVVSADDEVADAETLAASAAAVDTAPAAPAFNSSQKTFAGFCVSLFVLRRRESVISDQPQMTIDHWSCPC